MRYGMAVVIMVLVMVFGVSTSFAQKGPVEHAIEMCKPELNKFCKDVPPGEGRILACLYAHEDKLSGRCAYAFYDVVNQLERAINALNYMANECKEDITKFCSNVQPGEGRILKCIEKNEAKINSRCKQAMKDVGTK